MKIQVAIYPFCLELLPVVKAFNTIQDKYILKRIIAPLGYGLSGKDAGFIANQNDTGFIISDTLDEDSKDWEILLVTETENIEKSLESEMISYIQRTLQVNKKVVYYVNDYKNINNEIKILRQKYKPNFEIIDVLPEIDKKYEVTVSDMIQTPVVLIGGLIGKNDTGEVTLKLYEYLKNQGKNVMVFFNNPIGKIFEFESIYSVFKRNILEVEKIKMTHRIIQNYELKKHPDIILIEAPDTIMRYSNMIPNGYGIWTYMLSLSVSFDYFICCIPFESVNKQFIKYINDDIKNILGCSIDVVHAVNVILDGITTSESKKISIVHDNMKNVQDCIDRWRNETICVTNVMLDGSERLYRALENKEE